MKRLISIFLIGTILFTNCSCSNKKIEESKVIATPPEEEPAEPLYVDDNPITVGLYTWDSNTGYHYIESDIYLPWNKFKDIAVFNVLATHDTTINSWYMQDLFPAYWDYENYKGYKIGYNLTYTTDEGEFSWNIINPSDRMFDVFNYVQLYVYDDVSPAKGAWYDHLDDEEVTEGVLATSIKLCASAYIETIHSPMILTVFTYNDEEDFDPETRKYRGNSFHTINIHKTN